MDRSYYRKKYDARKTLDVFSVKLRDETDLHALNNELAAWWGRLYSQSASRCGCGPSCYRGEVNARATPNLNSRLGSECLTAFDRNGCTCCGIFVVDFHSRGN